VRCFCTSMSIGVETHFDSNRSICATEAGR
jgi:hypothetical protein